jgi:hypothetical protein
MDLRWVLAALTLVVPGCAHLDYVGRAHAPTTHVDLYFSEAEITRSYEVMGHLVVTGDQYIGLSRMQDKLMREAREKGADAVVIQEAARVRASEETRVSTSTTGDGEGTSESLTRASTHTVESKRIRALFVKYRD